MTNKLTYFTSTDVQSAFYIKFLKSALKPSMTALFLRCVLPSSQAHLYILTVDGAGAVLLNCVAALKAKVWLGIATVT